MQLLTRFYTTAECAKELNVCQAHVRYLIVHAKRQHLNALQIGKQYLVLEQELLLFKAKYSKQHNGRKDRNNNGH
jgi:hypothetical protein